MNKPATLIMRHNHGFMRSVALFVLVAFGGLVLEPAFLSIRTAQAASKPQQNITSESKLSKALQQTQETLTRIEQQLAAGEDTTIAQQTLLTLKDQIAALDVDILSNFKDIDKHIKQKKLPAVIMARHDQAVAQYQSEVATLLQNIAVIQSATTVEERKAAVTKAKNHLKGKKSKRSQQPFDPNNLPNKSLKANPDNKAKEKQEDFTQVGLFSNPNVKVAALGDFTYGNLPGASDPAYLATTIEVTRSPAIIAKAAELNHDPVAIFHWVRNNIQWRPAWGAMQNADLTLSAQRGNAMDIASLLVALLRASQIPARYVHGTIDVPEDKFRNWAGGFTNINAAADFAASGGIPTTTVVTGGKIASVKMEHIWVEAAIDYQPSRGAKNIDADSWVQMDPSFKQYEYLPGLDAVAISGINPEQLANDFINSGIVNETEGWVSGFDPTILQNAQTQAQNALEQYITDNLPNATVGDVIGGAKTIVQEFPVLPSSLPNRIVTTGARYGQLPTVLQHQISYAFATDVLGDPIDPITFAWPEINNQKITLSFKPATPEDEAALQSLLPEGEITDISQLPSSIPAYLINVIPELKVNGQTVKEGSPMQLGEELPFTTVINYRGYGVVPYTYYVIAGSYLSVAAVGGNVSPQKIADLKAQVEITRAKLESNDLNQIENLTKDGLLGDIFYAGTLGYYSQLNGYANLIGIQQKAYHYLAAGYGTFGYEPDVDYFFGVPRVITAGGAAMNIPILRISGADSSNVDQKKSYNLQVGLMSSALEHAIPEQLLNADTNSTPDAISAVKALSKANQEGQLVYYITQSNKSTILANIHHDEATMQEINSALNTGKEVITHTDAVSVPGWSGAGYIIIDPATGDGAYKIGGGFNGSIYSLSLTVLVMLLALFSAPVSAMFIFLISLVIVATNFIVLLDSLDCDADGAVALYLGIAALGALLSAGKIGKAIFSAVASFVYGEAISSGASSACNLINNRAR